MSDTVVREVSATDLRDRFRNGRYLERVAKGELQTRLVREGHPAPKKSGQPHCTRSQVVAYQLPSGKRIAMVHQYLRPDGRLGASGKPDPKWLLKDGVIYAVLRP